MRLIPNNRLEMPSLSEGHVIARSGESSHDESKDTNDDDDHHEPHMRVNASDLPGRCFLVAFILRAQRKPNSHGSRQRNNRGPGIPIVLPASNGRNGPHLGMGSIHTVPRRACQRSSKLHPPRHPRRSRRRARHLLLEHVLRAADRMGVQYEHAVCSHWIRLLQDLFEAS